MKEKILAITSYPIKGVTHGSRVVGIASYAKNTFQAIQKVTGPRKKITLEVLAEKLPHEENYRESKINVKRIWKRDSLTSFITLASYILKNKDAKTILFEFELSMFGGVIYLLPFPFFLAFLKLLNKKVVFVLHQVISDFDEIAPHVNIDQRSLKSAAMETALSLLYSYIMFVSSKVIVFEKELKDKLARLGGARKIVVIPHGIEDFKKVPTKKAARKKLGFKPHDFVVLSFGFLAWYKGTDWLIQAVNDVKKSRKSSNIKLVLAGGPNPNYTDKDYYQRYIRGVMVESKKSGIIVTGFIPEKDISSYFKASDLVVLPYRTFMSSSGPLSIALSFKKPFLLSPKLRNVLEATDMKKLLKTSHLKTDDLVFDNFSGDFTRKILKMKKSPKLIGRVTKFAAAARRERSWKNIGERYYQELVN